MDVYEIKKQADCRFSTGLARSVTEIEEAQRLRYRVFAREMGARLPDQDAEIDCDPFDADCDHLVVRERATERVVGTYRILDGRRADAVRGFYAETEFDFPLLSKVRPRAVEIGRACVDPAYRNGAVIWQLWAALTRYICARPYDFVIGCGSITLANGTHAAASVCRRMLEKHLSPPQWRARPRHRFPLDTLDDATPDSPIPPLIAGYLRLGAYICGEPAWDPDFNTADVLLWLPVRELNPHYANRLLRAA